MTESCDRLKRSGPHINNNLPSVSVLLPLSPSTDFSMSWENAVVSKETSTVLVTVNLCGSWKKKKKSVDETRIF